MLKKIPHFLQSILWSTNVDLLNPEKDKNYIIHQTLIFGSFNEWEWLFNNYSKEIIVKAFLRPYRSYTPAAFNFVKNYLLDLKNLDLDEQNYVTSISGSIRPRTTNSL